MAISHVWSHGQGGRPESTHTGLNGCLHRRCCKIAREFGCTSYKMNTTCIPKEHGLRRKVINHINEIFAQSRTTLACHRDLMALEIGGEEGVIRGYERFLAVILVSDWNVRAWILLEAMRGRRGIHVLCKNNKLVSIRDVLGVFRTHGRIDLVTLALNSQCLLPWRKQIYKSPPGHCVIEMSEVRWIVPSAFLLFRRVRFCCSARFTLRQSQAFTFCPCTIHVAERY